MKLTEVLNSGVDKFVIYGAQVVAYGAYVAISELCGRKPECFAVSASCGNPKEIEGIPVQTIENVSSDAFVIVAVTELLQEEIILKLKDRGFRNIFALTQREEYSLMSEYFNRIGRFKTSYEESLDADSSVDLVMYEVRNHRDKLLKNPPKLKPFEKSIQAGAELTDKRIASLTDNTGENISSKNKQYCEMTAAYWAWKNTNREWTGIEHYRRRLLVKPEALNDDVDVVLPLPYICYPSASAQLGRFISRDVINVMLNVLRELHPEEYDDYCRIFYGRYQYTYNLVCARKATFDDYCNWFFGITERMEKTADEAPKIKTTRALSYVAEALTNIYFMHNSGRLNILHTAKEIYT